MNVIFIQYDRDEPDLYMKREYSNPIMAFNALKGMGFLADEIETIRKNEPLDHSMEYLWLHGQDTELEELFT